MTEMSHLLDFFSEEMEKIKIPKDMDDAKALGTVLSKYKDTYYTQVLVAYFATYVLYPFGASREEHRCIALVHVCFVFFFMCSDYNSSIHSPTQGRRALLPGQQSFRCSESVCSTSQQVNQLKFRTREKEI